LKLVRCCCCFPWHFGGPTLCRLHCFRRLRWKVKQQCCLRGHHPHFLLCLLLVQSGNERIRASELWLHSAEKHCTEHQRIVRTMPT
jgi:hypothetical protein